MTLQFTMVGNSKLSVASADINTILQGGTKMDDYFDDFNDGDFMDDSFEDSFDENNEREDSFDEDPEMGDEPDEADSHDGFTAKDAFVLGGA